MVAAEKTQEIHSYTVHRHKGDAEDGRGRGGETTAAMELARAEARMLEGAGVGGSRIHSRRITLQGPEAMVINYLVLGADEVGASSKPACVLVHGFGCGIGSWAANYAALASQYVVYGIDMVGFGRSSRPNFRSDGNANHRAHDAEDYFVQPIEQWRQAMCRDGHFKLRSPVWIGHSLGGFIVSCYALRHPSCVERMILVDPWGLHAATDEDENRIPAVLRTLVSALPSPLSPMRWLDRISGLGKTALARARRSEHHRWYTAVREAAAAACAARSCSAVPNKTANAAPEHEGNTSKNKENTAEHKVANRGSATGSLYGLPPNGHWRWVLDLVLSLSTAEDELVSPGVTGDSYRHCHVPQGGMKRDRACVKRDRACVQRGEADGLVPQARGNRAQVMLNAVTEYQYYLSAIPAYGGEHAFKALCRKGFFHFAWNPKAPALRAALSPGGALAHATLDIVYGEHTWIDRRAGQELSAALGEHRCGVSVVPGAGHHVYLDEAEAFNAWVLSSLAARRR